MKLFTGFVLCVFLCKSSAAQYYYKDIVLTAQASDTWKAYQENRVRSVKIASLEANGEPVEGFACDQVIAADYSEITTTTRSSLTDESVLTAHYSPKGFLKETVDTGNRSKNVTEYKFNEKGQLVSIANHSVAGDSPATDSEQHLWTYDETGKPVSMIKIRNTTDSSFFRFVKDEHGNIAEEHGMHRNLQLPVIYYYYDGSGRITDVVKYNAHAKRLLPDFIFEYDEAGKLHSMLTVPEDTNGYQQWIYDYAQNGLRMKETCFNKKKVMIGQIVYRYSSK